MSETGKKLPISKLAKVSFVFSIISLVCELPVAYLWYLELFEIAAIILHSLALLFLGLGIIFAIFAFLSIIFNRRIARSRTFWMALAASFICLVVVSLIVPILSRARPIAVCASNFRIIHRAMFLYAEYHDSKFPSPQNWCDILVSEENISERQLCCLGTPGKGDKGLCHYAMNPYCEPNSPNDVVLLFETRGGWNQYGGPELISFDNHVRKGANILFNDGNVEFIKPEDVGKLKWKAQNISEYGGSKDAK